jgi:aldehyde:ferredoxin oxidoreductase
MFGYAGKFLFVDLTEKRIWVEEFAQEFSDLYFGGYGFGAKILFDRMNPGADPLGPENIIGFITGPVVATGAMFGGRYTVVCKSPATNAWNDANSGGYFAPELKRAGYDALFVQGASETPVYIWIDNAKVEIRDASHLWGLTVNDTRAMLEKKTGEKNMRTSLIGPAGEKLSLIAAVMNDDHRAAGRGGPGAVMGSKKLKAVAVHGNTFRVDIADREKFNQINRAVGQFVTNTPADHPMAGRMAGQKAYGTTAMTPNSALSGDSPVKNWRGAGQVDFTEEEAHKLDVSNFDAKYKIDRFSCAACPLGCAAIYDVQDGEWPVGVTGRPEYETMAAFGCNCLVSDIDAIIKCNDLCNRYGFDTISAGSVIAWVMECYEHGVLTKDDLDGIEAKWRDGVAMVALMEKMVTFEGCGKFLALGQAGAADAFGKGHEHLAVAGRIEPGMHDGRMPGAGSRIRAYKYDPTPGRHTKGFARQIPPGKDPGEADVEGAANSEMTNCAGMCVFGNMMGYNIIPGGMTSIYETIIGRTLDNDTYNNIGKRILLLRHSFNIREGYTRDKATMSPRLEGRPPITGGPNKDIVLDTEGIADQFYKALGCDIKTGKPYKETLEKIGGMDEVIRQLY